MPKARKNSKSSKKISEQELQKAFDLICDFLAQQTNNNFFFFLEMSVVDNPENGREAQKYYLHNTAVGNILASSKAYTSSTLAKLKGEK